MMGGRVTTAQYNGKSYMYLPGTKSLYRYTFENGKFAQDPTWGSGAVLERAARRQGRRWRRWATTWSR